MICPVYLSIVLHAHTTRRTATPDQPVLLSASLPFQPPFIQRWAAHPQRDRYHRMSGRLRCDQSRSSSFKHGFRGVLVENSLDSFLALRRQPVELFLKPAFVFHFNFSTGVSRPTAISVENADLRGYATRPATASVRRRKPSDPPEVFRHDCCPFHRHAVSAGEILCQLGNGSLLLFALRF